MTNAFIGKADAPSDAELAAELGSSKTWWDRIRENLHLEGEWHCYSKKAGWSMRLKAGKRNIVYLIPGHREFNAALVLGDRALKAAKERGLAEVVAGGKRYVEGTDVRLPVTGAKDVATVQRLVEIKLEF